MSSQKQNHPTILIAGPTASGKSSLAIAIAQKYNGVIINADSMQVYQELRIITARPSIEDEAFVPHLMYGDISGAERYSTGRWAKDVRIAINEVYQAGKTPIIIGGTGLYFRTLIQGMAIIPPVPDDISLYWRQESTKRDTHDLHKILTEKDPIMAQRLNEGDTQRISRALEVIEATGKSLSYWQQQKDQPVLSPDEKEKLIKIVIKPERAQLYARINSRFETMVDLGGLEEVQTLQTLQLDSTLPLMRALGVPELLDFLRGDCTKTEAIEKAQMMSRRYAKRQMTWLRGQMLESQNLEQPNKGDEGWTWFAATHKQQQHKEVLEAIARDISLKSLQT